MGGFCGLWSGDWVWACNDTYVICLIYVACKENQIFLHFIF